MEANQPVTLLERVREAIGYKHYSIRTERAYVEWVRRFVHYHGRRQNNRARVISSFRRTAHLQLADGV